MGTNTIFVICVILEFLIMFTGMTLFFDKLNLVQISFHVFSIIATSLYILNDGHYQTLWKVWIVGGYFSSCNTHRIIPLTIEIMNAISARVHYKRIMKSY